MSDEKTRQILYAQQEEIQRIKDELSIAIKTKEMYMKASEEENKRLRSLLDGGILSEDEISNIIYDIDSATSCNEIAEAIHKQLLIYKENRRVS